MKLLDEIEQGAASDGVPITTLLRKCLILTHRLNSKPATDWVERELNGYAPSDELPGYRKLKMVIKANVVNYTMKYTGWTVPPAILGKNAEACSECLWKHSAAATDRLLATGEKGGPICLDMGDLMLVLNSSDAIEGQVLSAWGEVSNSQVANVLEAVRNRVLMFALNIQREYPDAGEVETKMARTERPKVDQIFHTTVYGSANVVGSSQNSNIVLNVNTGDFAALSGALAAAGVSADDLKALREALSAEPNSDGSRFGPKVSKWFGKMLSKAADGSWGITTNAASDLLGKALERYYGLS